MPPKEDIYWQGSGAKQGLSASWSLGQEHDSNLERWLSSMALT